MALQVPRDLGFNDVGWRRLIDAVIQLVEGRNNAVGRFTLTPGATTTIVSQPNCSKDCEPQFSARTASAATALATTYVSAVNQGSFTVTHANSGVADRTFGYSVTGG
jgi:hypothetical protein